MGRISGLIEEAITNPKLHEQLAREGLKFDAEEFEKHRDVLDVLIDGDELTRKVVLDLELLLNEANQKIEELETELSEADSYLRILLSLLKHESEPSPSD